MNNNKFPIIILLFTITFSKVTATEQIYYPAKKLPPELSYLLETIQSVPLGEASKDELLQNLKKIDHALFTNTDNTLFVIKSELYKSILANIAKSKNDFDYTFTSPGALKKAKILLKTTHEKYTSFSLWLLENITNDLEQVFLSPQYPQLIRRARKTLSIKDKRLLQMERKLLTLLPIFDDFLTREADEFNQELIVHANKALKTVANYCNSFEHVFQPKRLNEQLTLSYFQLTDKKLISSYKPFKEEKIKTFFAKKEKIVEVPKPAESIAEKLDKIIKEETVTKPVQPVAQWMPKEELSPFPTPDPDYVPPANLPRPINDWLTAKNLFLFPEPDENYIPPKVLPKPINDWLKEETKFSKKELPAVRKKIIEKTKKSILDGIPLDNDADDDWFLE